MLLYQNIMVLQSDFTVTMAFGEGMYVPYGLKNLFVFTSLSVQISERDARQTHVRAHTHTHTLLLNIINV